jgi:dihydrofolate reductase
MITPRSAGLHHRSASSLVKEDDIMRTLAVLTFVTLDGVMQAPGGPEEDPTGGFTFGGWSIRHFDDAVGEVMDRSMSVPFDLLLGRKTYEIFAAHWPYSTDPGADRLNAARKYVASRTLESADWNNSTVLNGDVVAQVRTLKEADGPEIQVHGSWNLIQTLLANDLVDELRLKIFPVVVGKGKRLFGEGTVPRTFTVRDATTSGTGVVMATYERAGEVETGSFAFEEPTDLEVQRREQMKTDDASALPN